DPFERLGIACSAEVSAWQKVSVPLSDQVDGLFGHDRLRILRRVMVDKVIKFDALFARIVVKPIFSGGTKEDEHHGMDDCNVLCSPLYEVRDVLLGVRIDGGIEG